VYGQGMEHSTHTLIVVRAISGSHQGKGKKGEGKYIQNINARDLIFQVKMNRKTFGGRAPPGPAGIESSSAPQIQEAKENGGQSWREMGKYIQNITARDLIFRVKMNQKTFGGRAPPGPAGGA